MEGFTVNHFAEQLPQASKQLADWLRSGQIRLPEHVEDGIERFPRALIMLFDGSHMGKLLVRTKTS
jgi:NADPH-dependent curcumin reductase CurA